LSGETATLDSLVEGKDRLVMVFWGVNCLPCLQEIEQLNREWEGPEFRRRLRMIAVNTDGLGAGALLKEMATREISIAFPVVTDEDHRITDTFVNGLIPLTVVIGKDRTVRKMFLGGGEETVDRVREEVLSGRGEKR
jgi:peroxiredoxin